MSETVPVQQRAKDPIAETKVLAQEVYVLARERSAPAVCQKLLRAGRALTERAEVVAVGIRSVGKSSLLNAVLGRELLPVDSDVSSNVYVRIGFGLVPPGGTDPGERVLVLFKDGREPVEADLSELADWASEAGNQGNRLGVSHVRVRFRAPLIVEGLTLTDTPGAGGLVAAHAAAVRAACQVADGLLVVLDHVQPISETVRDFLVSLGDPRRTVFAFNKIDTDGNTTRSIADTRELLGAAGAPNLAEAPMVATSAFLAAEALADGEQGEPESELWDESGVPELIDVLRSAILEPVKREQARALLAELGDSLRLLASPDVARLRAVERGGRVGAEALHELKRLRALDVRRELDRRTSRELPSYRVALLEGLYRAFERLEDAVTRGGLRDLRESLPPKTWEEVEGAWKDTVTPLHSMVTARAAEVGLGIELELPEIGLPGARPGTELPPGVKPPGKASRFIARLWKAVFKSMFFPPLAYAEYKADKKAEEEISDRESALTYLRRERDKLVNRLPEELRQEQLRLAEQAIAELETARAVRIATLEQVEEALRNPPTEEELERARERMREIRALDERVRALAGRV
jgi:GTPase SAR1 family protein